MSAAQDLIVLASLGFPALFAPLLARARGRIPAWLWMLFATVICLIPLAAPWLVFGDASRLSVSLVAIAGGIVTIKAIDWLARPRNSHDLIRVWLALTFWPALQIEDVAVRLTEPESRIRLVLGRAAAGTVSLTSGLALAALGQRLLIPDRGILIDSFWKTIEIYLLAGGSNHLLVALFALAGYRIQDGFRYPVLAHSILDFWSRYNVWIHRWLKQHVFKPIASRRRKPVLAVLAVFGTSGLLHEYLFLPIDHRLLGLQLGFFLIHGSARSPPRVGRAFAHLTGRKVPRYLAIPLTLAFVFLSMPPFIHCLDQVLDLHRELGALVLKISERAMQES